MTHPPAKRVYLLIDDSSGRPSVEAALRGQGYDVVVLTSAVELLGRGDLYEEGCVLAEWALLEELGPALQQRLCEVGSTLAVVVIVDTADVRGGVRAMELGAVTVLEKPLDPQALLSSLARALTRSSASQARRRAQLEVERRLAQLTAEEHAVLDLMIQGLPIKAISLRLGLSTRTVERRRKAILEKLHVGSLPELGVLLGRYWQSTGRNGAGRTA
jgi:FixJ family two-component response regulator